VREPQRLAVVATDPSRSQRQQAPGVLCFVRPADGTFRSLGRFWARQRTMTLPNTPDEVLATTRAVRKRLDFDRPVPKELIMECVDLAFQAPTGSNRQAWGFFFVEDTAKKKAIADLYGKAFDPYVNAPGVEYKEGDTRGARQDAVKNSATYLRENFHRAPVLVIPYALGRMEGAATFAQAGWWGSILPAFWSFMLAARARGLGTAWTTLHLPYEKEAAEILGIPYDKVTQCGLSPLAYTLGTDFKPGPRLESDKLVRWDSWE
jgi:nitroreductase